MEVACTVAKLLFGCSHGHGGVIIASFPAPPLCMHVHIRLTFAPTFHAGLKVKQIHTRVRGEGLGMRLVSLHCLLAALCTMGSSLTSVAYKSNVAALIH